MKKAKTPFITVMLLIMTACGNNTKEVLMKLEEQRQGFELIEKKHKLHTDIISVLNKVSENDNIQSKINGDNVTLIFGNNKINLNKNKLNKIETPQVIYSLVDRNTIEVEYLIDGVSRKGQLKNNNYNGVYITRYKDFTAEINLHNNDTTLLKETYKNGKPKKEIKYLNNAKEGNYREFHPNGSKKAETQYVNGKRNGLYIEWYNNGKLKTKVIYNNGAKTGEQIIYHKDVQLMKLKTFYKDGKRDGQEATWFPNSKGHYTVYYKNGKLEGEAVIYQENNKMMKMKGFYTEGTKNGLFSIWDEQGKGIFSAEYKYDQLAEIVKGTKDDEFVLFDIEDVLFKETEN